jgi:UDP:flavonoid glycosyltransferase YjiC (YdhE family)
MRVLCSSPPMEGVFTPFVPLGRALLAAGHQVLVATGPDLQARVASEGFASAVAGPSAMEGAITAMGDPAVVGAPDGESWHFGAAMFAGVIAPAKLGALRRLADEYRPDLILHPPVDVAGPLLAAERALPSVTYGFGQLLERQLVAALAERVAPVWRQAGLEPDRYAGIYRGRYLDPCPPSLQLGLGPAATITDPIRPEVPGDPHAGLPEWAGSLANRRVVYLSLGTVPFFNQPDKFVTLLAELAQEDVEVVVTVGELNDPAALGVQPANVHVERWLPLAPLLPHCDAVVCHAGSGTTLAALTSGLPLVLVPQGADQFTNADACQRTGVARVLLPGTFTSTTVRDAVQAILRPDSTERNRARYVAGEIAMMPTATDVVQQLEALVGGSR